MSGKVSPVLAAPSWRQETLRIADIRLDDRFQLRALGTDQAHVGKLERALRDDVDLPPIRVARIGKVLYLIGGHHRLEAHQRLRRATIVAEVARMSLAEALAASVRENTDHGKNLSRNDKRAHWARYVAEEMHLKQDGSVKGSTTIERELGGIYTRPTIRKLVKALGVDMTEWGEEFPGGYTPRQDEDALERDRFWNAMEGLEHFRSEYLTLESEDQRELRETARNLLNALDRGEAPPSIATGPLDI